MKGRTDDHVEKLVGLCVELYPLGLTYSLS